jgi:hypothetical protein
MFSAIGRLIRRFRRWARSGSAAEVSKDALEARRNAESDIARFGGGWPR